MVNIGYFSKTKILGICRIWPKSTEFHTFGLLSHLVKIKYKVENVNTSRSACKGPRIDKLLNRKKYEEPEGEQYGE